MTEESGEFECPRCENRMVRYRITKLWVHAECGRAGCFQVSYRRERIWLSDCQQRVLMAMGRGGKVTAERRWWTGARKIMFKCNDPGAKYDLEPMRSTLLCLEVKGFITKISEVPGQVAYKLNQEKCDEYRVFDLTNADKKGGE
jgi:hypothetical protein